MDVARPASPGSALTLASGVAEAARALEPLLGGDARREAETLTLVCLGLPRSALVTAPDRTLDAAERGRLGDWIARRSGGEPLAYLAGEREFWSLPLQVTPAVLVPR
ncbi:MAG: hypothetical protein EBS39_09940, partial [Gammaproteobacteria bacterium]|nr:hypothetical protein [Gammaproteobacteria bacterium]